ncbi:MAG: hypothetical protein JW938_03825 [Candidatus Omnitrophica bacterium]|nr:hypothetical protein [Candidatus Omnitrophota bacterium]
MKHLNIFILSVLLFTVSMTPRTCAENDPWWTQGYNAETEVVTSYDYDTGGKRIVAQDTTNAEITFFNITPKTEMELDEDEQSILALIRKFKAADPEIEKQALLDQVVNELPYPDINMIENIVGFDDFQNATGDFAYLTASPSALAISIYDAWFAFYQKEYPDPPKTLAEMEEINAKVFTELAKQFKTSPTTIKNTLYKLEKYQEKYNIPKNVPLSVGMQQATEA